MSSELLSFIKDALTQGKSREEIRAALVQAKWAEEEIDATLERFADVSFSIPVPAPKASASAREAFIYLVLFVTLYLTAFSIGSLWFSFINHWLPDELYRQFNYYVNDNGGIRQDSAMLLIAAPLFFWLSRSVQRRLTRHPEEQLSAVRRWLTYLTLFIAVSIIIGTLIALVHNVLSGELTFRFALKVLTILTITGSIFGYYLWDLRRNEETDLRPLPRQRLRAFVTSIALLTITTLVGGLYLSGSPAKERLRRLDEQHVQTLQQVTYAIDTFTQQEGRLPTQLQELWRTNNRFGNENLPRLLAEVPDLSYRTTASSSYELCARFALPTDVSLKNDEVAPSMVDPLLYPSWTHTTGITCFPRTVRPILK